MYELNYIQIGNRIKQRRKALSLTQKQLGERVGLSEGSISRYEHGKVEDATMSKLKEFAEALNVETSWLIGIKEDKSLEFEIRNMYKKLYKLPDGTVESFIKATNIYIDLLTGKE